MVGLSSRLGISGKVLSKQQMLLLNASRMHIALKKQGIPGGIKDLSKSMSSSL